MIICENCFCDTEIVSIIKNNTEIGECPLCKSRNVHLYDTEKQEELSNMFEDFLGIYTPASLLPDLYPKSETRLIQTELYQNWNIFNDKSESDIYSIITALCKENDDYFIKLFEQPVGIAELYEQEYLTNHSLLTTNSWEDFVTALKTENRFHTHFVNLSLLERFCSYIRKPYKAGDSFFRCRISTEEGIPVHEMGAPPFEKTTDGRANARGIRTLYLGDTEETTIYETRAGAYDYVTVGRFVLKEDIIVVDLKEINRISPFTLGLDCLEYAINKEHLNKINDEMSRIMRRSDSTLDYVPTQYLTDFIKNIVHKGKKEYSGIEYKSVMNSKGYNLALFEPELAECVDVDVYRIDSLEYGKHLVSS